MPSIVSTGQITIIDSNDARPITAYMTVNPGTQQIYSQDESTVGYSPSWFTANSNTGAQLTPKVYVATSTGATDITNLLTNRKFCFTQGGTAITTGTASSNYVNDSDAPIDNPFTVLTDASNTYLRIKGNLKSDVGIVTIFFEGDYTDPASGLVSHVITSVTLNTIKTGTNAVFITFRGNTAIEQATGATKTNIAIAADLNRSGGIDNTGLKYKWYAANASTQVSTSLSGYATKYGLKTTTAPTLPTASGSDLNVNIPASGADNAHNTLVINESAVNSMDVLRVDITDSINKTYSAYFTITDVSDPYTVQIASSTGDKLQNGQGSTILTPTVFYGGTKLTDLSSWTFTWYFYEKTGKRAAFIDTAKITIATGAPITGNTTGASGTITYSGTSYAFVAGDIVKAVKTNGEAYYYEVASSSGNVVTLRAPTTNTWLNYTAPTAGEFIGGVLFGCTAGGTRSSGSAGITVTGYEIDVKGTITVEANRP